MKKLLTLLTLLLLGMGSAWAQTASDKYLDLANYATIDQEGFSTNNGSKLAIYDDETSYLTVAGIVAQISTGTQKWITKGSGTNTSTETWNATGVFKGSSAYGATKVAVVNSNLTYTFKVTSCTEIQTLVKKRSGSSEARNIYFSVYEIGVDGSRISETAVDTKTASTQNSQTTLTINNLDKSKIYEATLTTGSTNNEFFYEIAFKVEADTRTVTSLSFAETSGTANLGETFTLPTLTKDPADLTGLTYESSNTSVATVDNTGAVTIKAIGKTTITVKYAGSETLRPCSATYQLTVVDPNAKTVTATFPFDTGAAGQVATVSADDVFSVTSVGVADMTYAGVGSDQGVTGTKMQPVSSASDNKSQYTKFTVTPKKGITFTPKKISFDAMRWGTDGSNKLHYYAESGSTSQELGNVNPNRNGKGNGWSHYEHNLEGINATSDAPFTLACYVYGLANTKQISFANIVIEGEYSGTAEQETMYAITTSVTPDGAGSVMQDPAGASLAEGTAVTFTASANTGYKFLNKWTVNGTEVNGESYSVASLSEDLTVEAQFKKLFAVAFNAGEGSWGTSTPLPTSYTEGQYTTPAANYYIVREGYTVTGWTDGTNNYGFGEALTLTGDITLQPIFTANTKTVANTTTEDVAINYSFDNTNGAPVINLENSTGYYVKQAQFDGETIDVAIYIDNRDGSAIEGKRGKTNNVGRANAQVNVGSKFTIPAVPGMKVSISKNSGDLTGTTIAGDAYSDGYVYTGTAETIDIIFAMESSVYLNGLTVTYPKTVFAKKITSAGYATLYCDQPLNFEGTGLTAYIATASGSTVNFSTVTSIPANTGVLLKGTAGDYEIPVAASTTDVTTNKFVGVTTATEVAAGIFVLMDGEKGVGFYKTTAAKFLVGANTAYLPADVAGARTFIGFDSEETTGIENANVNLNLNDEVFDLQGRRVAQPTKGLYIVNGKKVVK